MEENQHENDLEQKQQLAQGKTTNSEQPDLNDVQNANTNRQKSFSTTAGGNTASRNQIKDSTLHQRRNSQSSIVVESLKSGIAKLSEANSESNKFRAQFKQSKSVNSQNSSIIEGVELMGKKLSPLATGLSFAKGTLGTGIVFMPRTAYQGGWFFWLVALSLSACMTYICLMRLVAVKAKVGGTYDEFGEKILGRKGKIAVDITLSVSQFSFVTAYIYFIAANMQSVIFNLFNGYLVSYWTIGAFLVVINWFMCLERKIEKYAIFHAFGDFCVLLTCMTVIFFACLTISRDGFSNLKGVEAVNYSHFMDCIGFAIFSFEGIGVVCPLMEVTEKPELYPKIIGISVLLIGAFYALYSEMCILAFGNKLIQPAITQNLPQDNLFVQIVISMFCLNLMFTYPLNVNPTNIIIERYLFGSLDSQSKTKMWLENLNRFIVIISTVVLALLLDTKLNQFLSVVGAATCTPIAFTLPALFHYYACAETKEQKRIDMQLIVVSMVILVFCSYLSLANWDS